MSGVAEKARFYLERSVPQLREWEEKGIFSKEEIRTIVQKRNDFEHRVLSPGNKASDWSSFAQWEHSLESLRRKRSQRLKIKHLNSTHAGQARVLSIYDRGVGRHPSNAALWREYLLYTASIKASKRFRKTMTNALRMMPNDPQLWVMAGKRSASHGDMAAARSFFMRGCRFCTQDGTLWLEYARCEMQWLEKMDKKAKPGSAALLLEQKTGNDEDELRLEASDEEEDDEDGTILPEPSKTQAKVIDKQTAQQLQSNPALDGAIPIAIFDISRKQPFFGANVAAEFFFMFYAFNKVSSQPRITQHVLGVLDEQFPNAPATCDIHIRQPILGVDPQTADFPRALKDVLAQLKKYLQTTDDKAALRHKTATWIDQYLAIQNLDEGVRKVLEHVRKLTQAA